MTNISPTISKSRTTSRSSVQLLLSKPLPEDAIQRVKSRARQLAKVSIVSLPQMHGSHDRGWKAMGVVLGGLTIAATLLVMVTGVTLLLDRTTGRAFAQVIEKVKVARSVRFTTTTRFGWQPEIDGQMYLEGNRLRLEQFDGKLIQVGDLDRKQALFLDMHRKLAQSAEIDASLAKEFANPIDQLRRAKSNDAEQVGQEILKGRRTEVYRLHNVDLLSIKGGGEMLVWVDVESELPAKIIIRDSDPKGETEIRFDEFVWNEPLEARLFSLNVPDGFQLGIVITAPRLSKPKRRTRLLPTPHLRSRMASFGIVFPPKSFGIDRARRSLR